MFAIISDIHATIEALEAVLADIARRYRLSGGYIRNCALRAAFIAAEEGGALTNDHLERAIDALGPREQHALRAHRLLEVVRSELAAAELGIPQLAAHNAVPPPSS